MSGSGAFEGDGAERARGGLEGPEPHTTSGVILNLAEEPSPPLHWDRVFSCPVRSIEIEIGTGKGMFLRREAAARPDVGFLGVEKAVKFFHVCAERLARDARPNVRLVRTDAFDLLARWIPPGSVDAMHVYFPDPWPKKRHAKRRLLSPALFDLAARALRADALLSVATDVGPYFAEGTELLDAHPSFARTAVTEADRERVATHYAVKYAREGRTLHLGRWRRIASQAPPIPPPSRRRKDANSAPSPAR